MRSRWQPRHRPLNCTPACRCIAAAAAAAARALRCCAPAAFGACCQMWLAWRVRGRRPSCMFRGSRGLAAGIAPGRSRLAFRCEWRAESSRELRCGVQVRSVPATRAPARIVPAWVRHRGFTNSLSGSLRAAETCCRRARTTHALAWEAGRHPRQLHDRILPRPCPRCCRSCTHGGTSAPLATPDRLKPRQAQGLCLCTFFWRAAPQLMLRARA